MTIEVHGRQFEVDDRCQKILSEMARYAIRDIKKLYTYDQLLVPFKKIVEILDMHASEIHA